jgi:hypothetical protein
MGRGGKMLWNGSIIHETGEKCKKKAKKTAGKPGVVNEDPGRLTAVIKH